MYNLSDEEGEAGPVELQVGKIFSKRWKILSKLDDGNFGSVFIVKDLETQTDAALKAEPHIFGSFLKYEIQILKRMQSRNFIVQLLDARKKKDYSYMVTTLLGDNLSTLLKQCNNEFSVSTQVRLGIQILYGLKQLHETGYIHRDLKFANMAIGREGPESRIVHLLDFGLSREYIVCNEGKVEMRRPRKNTLYCSLNTHSRSEQGRPDDLWSMVYILVQMRGALPWDHSMDMKEIATLKLATSDEELLVNCPPQMLKITEHLRTLDYYKRPDYRLIFDVLRQILDKHSIKYSDPFDWESAENSPGPNELPFDVEDFSKNELGF